jgi:hypothetical protein
MVPCGERKEVRGLGKIVAVVLVVEERGYLCYEREREREGEDPAGCLITGNGGESCDTKKEAHYVKIKENFDVKGRQLLGELSTLKLENDEAESCG